MKALFIGRFQPFHNGHLKVVESLSKKYEEVIIGIGSSQYRDAFDNPFSSDERKLMIKKSLETLNIKNYRIILIPDIHNPPKWAEHVLSIISDFDVVISNNPFTRKLFAEKNYGVQQTQSYNEYEYSGKEIRKRISQNMDWQNLVPKSVFKMIVNVDGVNRIKKLSK